MTFGDFFDRLGDLDWAGVVVATIVLIVLAALWYGPIFGKAWSKASGMPYTTGMPPSDKLIPSFVSMFVFNIGIAYLAPFDDIEHALVWGVVVGLLIIGANYYGSVIWENTKTALWVINTAFAIVAVAASTYVQGLFL